MTSRAGRIPGRGPLVSIGVRHHVDLRHHVSILVLEDIAVVDELAEFGEGDIHHDRRRSTLPAAPLVDGADAVLIVEDVVRDGRVRHRGPERQVVLNNAGAGRGKKASESKQPWDNYKLLATGPGDRAFRSAKDSGCPLTK